MEQDIKYLNSDYLELIHKTDNLFFYQYKEWAGTEHRVYVSSRSKEVPEDVTYILNSEEFGFVDTRQNKFKMTEDCWLEFDEIKDIVDFINRLGKPNA